MENKGKAALAIGGLGLAGLITYLATRAKAAPKYTELLVTAPDAAIPGQYIWPGWPIGVTVKNVSGRELLLHISATYNGIELHNLGTPQYVLPGETGTWNPWFAMPAYDVELVVTSLYFADDVWYQDIEKTFIIKAI